MVLETCYSGCVGDTIATADPPGILLASTGCGETSSNSYRAVGDVAHGVWTYWIDCSPQGQMPNPPPGNTIALPDGTTRSVDLSLGDPLSNVFDQSATAVDIFSSQTPLKKDERELAPRPPINGPDPVGQTPAPCPPR